MGPVFKWPYMATWYAKGLQDHVGSLPKSVAFFKQKTSESPWSFRFYLKATLEMPMVIVSLSKGDVRNSIG